MSERTMYLTMDDLLGTCPTCHQQSGILKLGRDYLAYCDRHRVFWSVGERGSWQDAATDEAVFDQIRNYDLTAAG